jgi:putative ABC transport system permease protein
VRPAAAVRAVPPGGHLSRLASVAMAARMPPAVVLGTRAAFVRKLSAVLTIAGLALPMLMITIGLGFWSTLDQVRRNPADIGLAASVTVSPGPLPMSQAARIIAADPQVLASYSCVQADTLAPGQTSTITTFGMGTSARPYPFDVVQGHLYHAPEQAVATAALLTALRLKVGQFVQMWIGGVPVTVQIVGRIIDPANGGEVLAYGRDTLTDEGAPVPIGFYSLVLRPGVRPAAAEARLIRASGGQLDVAQVSNPAGQLGIVYLALAALIAVLALTGITCLLTASLVSQRDHQRDASVLRAMGLTPLQVLTAQMMRTTVLALVAVAAGAAAGLAVSTTLVSAVSRLYGLGAGLGRPPSATALAVAVALALGLAALAGVLPPRQTSRLPGVAVLGP